MIKQKMLNLMRAAGAFELMRMIHRSSALILTYHRFADRHEHGHASGKTPARALSEQLEYLTTHYRLVSMTRMIECLSGPGPMPLGIAAITIDDGYSDAYEIAYPLLRRYKAPATVYAVTEFVDGRSWLWTDKARYLADNARSQSLKVELGGDELILELNDLTSRRVASERLNDLLKKLPDEVKDDEIERLARLLDVDLPVAPPEEFKSISWEQAREMDRNGVEIGSHTMTHPILTNIGDERLRLELQGSKSRLEEELGRSVEQFCYPNGDSDERVQREVARAGYTIAVTCIDGLNKKGSDPLALRRIHTDADFTHFLQSASGLDQLKSDLRILK